MAGWALRTRPSEATVYSNRFRERRMTRFLQIVDDIIAAKGACRIVDLGGRFEFWKYLKAHWDQRPLSVTLVDLVPTPTEDPRFVSRQGDACDLPQFADLSFDLVFSNSVIEHVGNWQRKTMMAREVRRLAPRYFIQTPNFWFPVEPHFRAVALHWFPRPLQRALVMRRDFAFHRRAATLTDAYKILDDAALLDLADMRDLFPDATIEKERVGPFTKSLIAVR